MVPTYTTLDLTILRNDDVYEFPLRVIGPNLTGIVQRAQIRHAADEPGPALVTLWQVTNGNAEGVRLAGVTSVGGRWVNDVRLRINKSTRQGLGYAGIPDAPQILRWGYQIGGITRLQGRVILPPHVMDSDNAPAAFDQPYGYSGRQCDGANSSAGVTLTISADSVAELVIDGADLVGSMVVEAQNARDAVKPMFGNGAPAVNTGIVGSIYTDITDPAAPVFYGPKTGAGWGAGRGLKGGPGGNVMAIGPLSSASALAIAAGTPIVHTSAFAASGDRGGARYERVASGDVAAGLPGTFTSGDTGQRWQIAETVFNAAFFGYRGDDTGAMGSDNTQALRDCIATATRLRVRTIFIPWGTTGQGRFDGSIVDGDLAPGLCFVGEARGVPNAEYGPGVRLRYTGNKAMWNLVPTGGTSGWWTWEDLVFICSDPAGSAFDFNNTSTHGVVSDIDMTYSYATSCEWKRCFFYGAHGGANQTGDAIRAAKLFNSSIGIDCYARGWRHAPWFKGCDNNKIGMRCELNGGHIRIDASGTFGNDNTVESRFLGNTSAQASVIQYAISDSGNRTTFLNNSFENASPNAAGAYYFNGHGTAVHGAQFACKFWVAGPNAREVKIHDPHVRKFEAAWKPTYEAPFSWNFGGTQTDFRLRATGTSHNFRAIAGEHPRLIIADPDSLPDSRPSQFAMMSAGTGGIMAPRQHVLSALNWGWQNCEGTEASAGIAGMVADPAASTGWAVRLAAVANAGISAERVIGRDISPSIVAVTVRSKVAASSGWVALVKRIRANGDVVTEGHPLRYGTGGAFNVDRFTLDMRDWSLGDRLVYLIYNGGAANGNIDLDTIVISTVQPAIAPIGVAPTAADYNALLTMLREAGVMA